jgi:VTT domain
MKYGVASVFLARVTAVVRAFVPLLAGIFRMSSGHFYFANVLSALVWAPLHVFPGIFLGMAIALGGRARTATGSAGHRRGDHRCDRLELAEAAIDPAGRGRRWAAAARARVKQCGAWVGR